MGGRSAIRSNGCWATGRRRTRAVQTWTGARRSDARAERHDPRRRSPWRIPACRLATPSTYAAQGAVQVLSGGMGARLFTEVREKRGLCYSVYASYQTFKDRACVMCYAGTTNERAQETLDVTVAELRRLQEGVDRDEVERVQAGLKIFVIMQGRVGPRPVRAPWRRMVLPGPRPAAGGNPGRDQRLTPAAIVEHVRRYPARDCTVVTLGPSALKFPK